MGMLEARMRIATNNTQTPVYSPQYIVSCSRYAQGMYILILNNTQIIVYSRGREYSTFFWSCCKNYLTDFDLDVF